MKNNFWVVLVIFSFLWMTACRKDKNEWKKPTDVAFKADVNRGEAMSGTLKFTGGTIVLREFSFDGERLQGDDVYFEKQFPGGLTVALDANKLIPELDFDIPQGNYTKITIELEIEGSGSKSIAVNGSYTNSNGDTYPLRLELEEIEIYTVVAKDISGSSEIVLNKDLPTNALITFDPVHWFGTVSAGMLDNASLVDVGGVMTILINDANNEDILDKVTDRIDEATEVAFD